MAASMLLSLWPEGPCWLRSAVCQIPAAAESASKVQGLIKSCWDGYRCPKEFHPHRRWQLAANQTVGAALSIIIVYFWPASGYIFPSVLLLIIRINNLIPEPLRDNDEFSILLLKVKLLAVWPLTQIQALALLRDAHWILTACRPAWTEIHGRDVCHKEDQRLSSGIFSLKVTDCLLAAWVAIITSAQHFRFRAWKQVSGKTICWFSRSSVTVSGWRFWPGLECFTGFCVRLFCHCRGCPCFKMVRLLTVGPFFRIRADQKLQSGWRWTAAIFSAFGLQRGCGCVYFRQEHAWWSTQPTCSVVWHFPSSQNQIPFSSSWQRGAGRNVGHRADLM